MRLPDQDVAPSRLLYGDQLYCCQLSCCPQNVPRVDRARSPPPAAIITEKGERLRRGQQGEFRKSEHVCQKTGSWPPTLIRAATTRRRRRTACPCRCCCSVAAELLYSCLAACRDCICTCGWHHATVAAPNAAAKPFSACHACARRTPADGVPAAHTALSLSQPETQWRARWVGGCCWR